MHFQAAPKIRSLVQKMLVALLSFSPNTVHFDGRLSVHKNGRQKQVVALDRFNCTCVVGKDVLFPPSLKWQYTWILSKIFGITQVC